MNNLSNKIKIYLGRTPDFKEEIKLKDDGDKDFPSPYISEWNAKDKVKPTDEQLNALENEATKLENNAIAVSNRQKEYGTVSKQIEFITEKGLEAWKTNVQAIKTKYPKE
jgi:archaellum component FlaC